MEIKYFHMFANGDDAKNFITSEEDFKAAFNRFAICSHKTEVTILSFSIEDTHPHALLRGTLEACTRFVRNYENTSKRSIVRRRGSLDGMNLHCELYEINDERYLMNVASYTIVQATKDGKPVMPYDYLYGTGALYFRSKHTILPWMIEGDHKITDPQRFGDLTIREKLKLCTSKATVPDDWLVCNGYILPTNYVDIQGFEQIFRTHNCFRTFLCSSKNKDEEIMNRMSFTRGVALDDMEARKLCADMCTNLFGRPTTYTLSTDQRILLARQLKKNFNIAYRQLANLVKIPEGELRKYVK